MNTYYDIEEYEDYYRKRDPEAYRVILHSDLNNFFASVECVLDPRLKNVPLAVCGDEELRHGIVLAKNELAKKYGIRTGDTINDAVRKCNFVAIRQTKYSEYVRQSVRVREIYLRYATRIETFGIDEAWIDVSALAARRGGDVFVSGKIIADEIRNAVKSETGLTVSIGVSFNKTFSKLASDMKKPDAVTVISYDDYKNIIWNMPVGELLFVGRKTKEVLKRLKINSVGDAAHQRRVDMKNHLGKFGELLWDRANGYDVSPVSYYHNTDETKSISNSTTTPYDLTTSEEVMSVLIPLCEAVTEQMRSRFIKASVVRVYIKYSDFSSFVRQIKISPTNSTKAVLDAVATLFSENVRVNFCIRSVGVGVEDFSDCHSEQENIFDAKSAVDKALDSLREKYGDGIIKRGCAVKNVSISSFDKKHVAFNSNI